MMVCSDAFCVCLRFVLCRTFSGYLSSSEDADLLLSPWNALARFLAGNSCYALKHNMYSKIKRGKQLKNSISQNQLPIVPSFPSLKINKYIYI